MKTDNIQNNSKPEKNKIAIQPSKTQQTIPAMKIPRITPLPEWPQEAPLNESHLNLMQSWLNLRGMDNKLAQDQGQKDKKRSN
ncbi:hypothetical protein SAMN04487941_3317 [Pontibacter akesuensis]|uniref:Uncharacterized protein n=2 Tax=Pontibacter akesuensis TaxID=388950 RepID=A0A1I7K2F2_9BACT|nr:hypothetical protein GCM10007389_31850 [Pontibacter akesuensis]SFU91614.1 hypothetical protein SAMN04487941_3317 [Pontibacter akesuensis]